MDAETLEAGRAADVPAGEPDLDSIFREHYGRVARVIARVVRDRGRAEDLAVEVFLRLWKARVAAGANLDGWLYRTAVRIALDELRRCARRRRYEKLAGVFKSSKNPEEIRAAGEEQERVRATLARLRTSQAELLVLRSDGLSYAELAAALGLHPGSIGKLLERAQASFRKQYVRRYGKS